MAARNLVVDASVAGAAGGMGAEHPTALRCRDFLATMLEQTAHSVVFSPEIEREWNDHQSQFARGWRLSMSARKRVILAVVADNEPLRRGIENCPVAEQYRAAMRKDLVLIEAALTAHKAVVSRDEAVRSLYRANLGHLRPLRRIGWVNPDRPEEDSINWLLAGGRVDRRRMLGYAAEEG